MLGRQKKQVNDFRITNYGVDDVTGSCILVEIESEKLKILLDYGMFQSNSQTVEEVYSINRQKLRVPIEELTHVVILHSHNDHCGSVPLLGIEKYGFNGKIISTALCAKLSDKIMHDSAHIMESETKSYNLSHSKKLYPLYVKDNVDSIVGQIRGYGYETIQLSDKCTLELIPSGHLSGSSMALITLEKEYGKKKTLLYTSDFYYDKKNKTSRHFTKSIPDKCIKANVIITESTYGDRIREFKDNMKCLEEYIISECVEKNRILFIPTFSQHRSSVICYMLYKILNNNKQIADKHIPIFFCSKLLKECHDIILDESSDEFYDEQWKGLQHLKYNNGFTFLTTGKDVETRILNNSLKIVVASSGMCNAGFSNMIAKSYVPNTKVSMLFTGYTGNGTLGRDLLEGKDYVNIQQLTRKVRCKILEPLSLSCHADQNGIVDFIKSCDGRKLTKVLIIHGDDNSRMELKDRLDRELNEKVDVEVFKAGTKYKF